MDRSNPRPDATRTAGDVPSGDFAPALALDVAGVQLRLEAGNGGYEIVHASPGSRWASALVAPEPDRQQPHEDDEL